ncbi:MAG: SDR family oxidoreductase [Sphingobacteriales bacterium]|nr:MAG: SDR family oxidoreductase [Sphingobacteriales bacterium]
MNTKTAIITGATKGIGRAIALKFLQEGYNIGICARNHEDLDRFRTDCKTGFPQQKIIALQADLQLPAGAEAFGHNILQAFEHIDVLVNNAGIFLPGTVLEETFSQLEQQINTNLYSAYILSQLIGNKMRTQASGHIINVCSLAGLQAYAGGSSYSISKYAMLGMSDNFRAALKPYKVKVTAVCPGPTMSASWEGSGVPEEKLMPAEDIAAMIFSCAATSFNTCVDRLVINPLADL